MMNPKADIEIRTDLYAAKAFQAMAIGDWFNDGEEWSVKLLGKSNELGRSGMVKNGIFEGLVSEEVRLVVVVSALIGVGVIDVTVSVSDRTEETCNSVGFGMVNGGRE